LKSSIGLFAVQFDDVSFVLSVFQWQLMPPGRALKEKRKVWLILSAKFGTVFSSFLKIKLSKSLLQYQLRKPVEPVLHYYA